MRAHSGHASALPIGKDDLLAGEHAGRQRQEQRPQLGRADCSAMNLRRWLAAVFVLLALAGCVQVATGQEPALCASLFA
jgi:hypothetical protein